MAVVQRHRHLLTGSNPHWSDDIIYLRFYVLGHEDVKQIIASLIEIIILCYLIRVGIVVS